MGNVKMLYVEHVRVTKAGRVHDYYYYRRARERWGRIKGEPGGVEFAANYMRLHDTYEGRDPAQAEGR